MPPRRLGKVHTQGRSSRGVSTSHKTLQSSPIGELSFFGHKLKHRKFGLNPRKNFFPLRVTEPWPRLPREAVESPSLEIFQTRLDKVLYSLL